MYDIYIYAYEYVCSYIYICVHADSKRRLRGLPPATKFMGRYHRDKLQNFSSWHQGSPRPNWNIPEPALGWPRAEAAEFGTRHG